MSEVYKNILLWLLFGGTVAYFIVVLCSGVFIFKERKKIEKEHDELYRELEDMDRYLVDTEKNIKNETKED